MAFDPETGKVYSADNGEVPTGHIVNMAAEIDTIFYGSEASVVFGQKAAREVALELNTLPPEERTAEMRDKAVALSRDAHAAAADANLELLERQTT